MRFAFAFLALCVFASMPVWAGAFESWLQGVREQARGHGISEAVIQAALSDVAPIPRVLELDRKQPEGRLSFARYRQNVVTPDRIARGRD